ncbi:UDP-N-acetylglucosamine 2-epimerase [Candidatus Termititenax aidoneus]|uniref:UDP-N-acetylglucosamine 2-epimerase (non-hydrolyzing) n=1 Tax=Termititenax aidoneus TaxID=2218524 RepID=A0A388T915_TERA1|nr:UDP-N-acetylglucosamine 2-epimerase [Candidatus Termititenax aidoneus]
MLGTRPEAIKLAPLIRTMAQTAGFQPVVCATGQHKEMLAQALKFFQIKPQFNLKIMRRNQTLSGLTARLLSKLDKVINKSRPDCLMVQGDTTTALAGALAGYYHKIPVAHVEAGLRSGDKHAPYPEELNRILISRLADYHFAPTQAAAANLKKEGVTKNILVSGNTVLDALFWSLRKIKENPRTYEKYFAFLAKNKKIILVTGHRRESFGRQFENICLALRDLARRNKDAQIVYPVHLNPQVQKPVAKILKKIPNVHLLKPLAYPYLLWLLDKCYLALTDSGGLQEEAPSLGKPVLVLRKVTERLEGLKTGGAQLVGTDRKNIVRQVEKLLTNKKAYKKMASAGNPYGDGRAVFKILNALFYKKRV